jgi:hypothetical protein
VKSWSLRRVQLLWPAALLALLSAGAHNPSGGGISAPPNARALLPTSYLAVRDAEGWHTWWRSSAAPQFWSDSGATLASAAQWMRATVGVEFSELVLAGSGEAWRTRLIVVRVDPRVVHLSLDTASVGRRAAWTIDRLRAQDVFAVNAGQFSYSMPWGWVVLHGRQFLPAETGPLSSAFAVDSSGAIHWAHGDLSRGGLRHTAWAFQSYPTLLRDGRVPTELLDASGLIDVEHRDARAAIGEDRDGRIIVALTRFDALGETLGFVPFGLTTPEMSAVMGALGARDAVMLDGGISAQLAIRDEEGPIHRWRGARSVPLALVGRHEPRHRLVSK